MAKVHILGSFIFFCCIIYSTSAQNNAAKFDNGRNSQRYNDPISSNRDYYNNVYRRVPQNYDRRFRNYNSEILAPQARTTRQEMQTPVDGAYLYSYDTDNGIHVDEHGVSVQSDKNEQTEVVEGSYSFVSPEGLHVQVRYTADENGFHPSITYGGVDGTQFARHAQPAGVVLTKRN